MLIWTLLFSIAAGLIGLIVFVVSLWKGQLDNQETTKFQIFRENNPDND